MHKVQFRAKYPLFDSQSHREFTFNCAILVDFPDFSLHLFDDSDFQMGFSTKFPEIVATDSLDMRENIRTRILKKAQKFGFKVFDLWRAERSEVRKLESNICHVHLFLKKFLGLPDFGCPQNFSHPITSKLDNM